MKGLELFWTHHRLQQKGKHWRGRGTGTACIPKQGHTHPKTRVHTSQGSAGIPYSRVHIRTNSLRVLLQANWGTAIFQHWRGRGTGTIRSDFSALARKRDRYSMHPKAAHTSQGARIHPKTRAHTSQGSAGIPYSSVHIRTNSLRDLLQANRGTAIFQRLCKCVHPNFLQICLELSNYPDHLRCRFQINSWITISNGFYDFLVCNVVTLNCSAEFSSVLPALTNTENNDDKAP